MNTEKLNHWLALIANIGVLVGIIFLVIEIRQNTDALYAETNQAIFSGGQAELYTSMEHPDIFRLMAHPELEATFEERIRLDSFLAAALGARQFAWRQYKAGSVDEATWETELVIISILVGSERNREWWTEVGSLQFTGEFHDLVSEKIRTEPLHPYWKKLAAW